MVAIIDAVMLYFGVSGSRSFVDQASQTPTGRDTEETMARIIIGIIAWLRGDLIAPGAGR